MVASRVLVVSKHSDDDQYRWECDGTGSFTITPDTSGKPIGRGTQITLCLMKEYVNEVLEEENLKHVVRRESRRLGVPIKLFVEKTEPRKDVIGDSDG